MYSAEGVFRRGMERNFGWIGLRDAREIVIGISPDRHLVLDIESLRSRDLYYLFRWAWLKEYFVQNKPD